MIELVVVASAPFSVTAPFRAGITLVVLTGVEAVDDVTTAINKRKVFDRFMVISLLDVVGCMQDSTAVGQKKIL